MSKIKTKQIKCDIKLKKVSKRHLEQSYWNKLVDKLDELFPKGEVCSHCGKWSRGRSKALVLTSFAFIYIKELVKMIHANSSGHKRK